MQIMLASWNIATLMKTNKAAIPADRHGSLYSSACTCHGINFLHTASEFLLFLLSAPDLVFSSRFSHGGRLHSDILAVSLGDKNHSTVDEGIQGVILAHTHVYTRVVNSTALTLDDVSGLNLLATENLNSESFAFRLTTVLRTTYTFFMCHFFLIFCWFVCAVSV